MIIVISMLISFLCGSIPCGYILAKKFCGIDIRTKGSGNIGSTNMKRILGSKMSIATQVLDISKGLIPVAMSIILSLIIDISIDNNLYYSLVAFCAILGHNYTPFLGFNGGKGVNTTLGAFFLLTPIAVLSGVAVYFLLKPLTKIVAIRSMCLGITIPLVSFFLNINKIIVYTTILSSILLIIRHKSNIIKIINKEY